MVIHCGISAHQLFEPVEQMFQPQHGADAFIEGVLVEDQGGGFQAVAPGRRTRGVRDCFTGVARFMMLSGHWLSARWPSFQTKETTETASLQLTFEVTNLRCRQSRRQSHAWPAGWPVAR